jgi:hypothetical protein
MKSMAPFICLQYNRKVYLQQPNLCMLKFNENRRQYVCITMFYEDNMYVLPCSMNIDTPIFPTICFSLKNSDL